jgi:hypothetical protein
MIFSYGFLEEAMTSAKELFLGLEMPDDDPLAPAKMRVSTVAPGVRLFDTSQGQGCDWDSDFIWLMCVNEEDGVEFKVLRKVDGERELRMFWKDQEMQETSQLRSCLEADPLWPVFQLRAVAQIQERVEGQLQEILNPPIDLQTVGHGNGTSIRDRPWALAVSLLKLESELLQRAHASLEEQVSARLTFSALRSHDRAAEMTDVLECF